MLTEELLKSIQADRERQIAQAQRERLATTAKPEPEPWTWLRDGPAGPSRTPSVRPIPRGQARRPATDGSL
jgi:hypothetical protein